MLPFEGTPKSLNPPMFIYIARHAWAYDRDSVTWPDDSLRELTPEGKQRYAEVVRSLASRGCTPERIATSPYVRCRQTAEVLAVGLTGEVEICELDALVPGSDIDAVFQWTAAQEVESVCWVGHAPDVSYLAAALVGRRDTQIRFAKGGIAAVRLDEPINYGIGNLQWLVTAKVLGV